MIFVWFANFKTTCLYFYLFRNHKTKYAARFTKVNYDTKYN